jgi:hypothetical protein
MKTSGAFMTAVPLTLLLVAILAVLVAVTPGAFRFDAWPDAPKSALSERDVVVDVPVAGAGGAHADARPAPSLERDGAVVAVTPPSEPVERRQAPAPAAAPAPQVVADTDPTAGGGGATSRPAPGEPAPEELEPLQVPAPELPAPPALPAKDLPGAPDQTLSQSDADLAARPRDLQDDQE